MKRRQGGEGTRGSGDFKGRSWGLERGRESTRGQNGEQRRLKEAQRREKEHWNKERDGEWREKLPPVVLWDIKEGDG